MRLGARSDRLSLTAVLSAAAVLGGSVLGCAPPGSAPASTPKTGAPHDVAADRGAHAELEGLVGAWHIDARNPRSGETFTMEYRVARILGGHWYQGDGVAPALGITIRDTWGKDPKTGEVVRVLVDSAGTFAIVRGRGWVNDVLVLEGDARGAEGSEPVRETIRRRGPDTFEATWESSTNGTWSAYSVETLRRRAP